MTSSFWKIHNLHKICPGFFFLHKRKDKRFSHYLLRYCTKNICIYHSLTDISISNLECIKRSMWPKLTRSLIWTALCLHIWIFVAHIFYWFSCFCCTFFFLKEVQNQLCFCSVFLTPISKPTLFAPRKKTKCQSLLNLMSQHELQCP